MLKLILFNIVYFMTMINYVHNVKKGILFHMIKHDVFWLNNQIVLVIHKFLARNVNKIT